MHIALVRAYKGEPLKRVVIECGKRVVYVANPNRMVEIASGQSYPVGFPYEDVFKFDSDLYARLSGEWESSGQTGPSLWRQAVLLTARA